MNEIRPPPSLAHAECRSALADWLREAAEAHEVEVEEASLLSGGSIQQNWLLRLRLSGGPHAGSREWVLRTDSPSSVAASRSRDEEYAFLRAAHAAGARVPEPLFLGKGSGPLGAPFFLMRRVGGTAQAHRVVRSDTLGGGREALLAAIGQELARIHSIEPPRPDLPFLGDPPAAPALAQVAVLRERLDGLGRPQPVVEWGLRAIERNPPCTARITLCHNDFRTGNVMVDETGVTGILDWEFADWGDPLQDIGWFCARCWRFGSPHEAGGIGPRDAFYNAYEAESGQSIDREAVRIWELMATLRWAVIALDQAERHLSGREPSLELALTGHILPELEMDILRLTAEGP